MRGRSRFGEAETRT